jgi:ribosome maturation factor RimP
MAGNNKGLCAKVALLVKDAVEACGCRLWDVDYVKDGKDYSLVIYIDKEEGISLTDCETVNYAVDPIIEEADLIKNSYFLEISSPGIERELKTYEHLAAYLGKQVAVKLYAPKDGTKNIVGTLESIDEENSALCVNGISLKREECASVKNISEF